MTFDRRYSPSNGADYAEATNGYKTQWGDGDLFDSAPSTATRMHIVVRDADGEISGTKGTLLERFEDVDTVDGAVAADGSSNFLPVFLENRSDWIKCTAPQSVLQAALTFGQATLTGGVDGLDEANITLASIAPGYDLYKDAADVDVSLILSR